MWVYVHADGSVCILYVDDFMFVTTAKHCWELGAAVEFSKEAAPTLRNLGAVYPFNMTDYIEQLEARFERDWSKPAPKVPSAFATSPDNKEGYDEP